jgi:hypothetical protein
MRNAAAVVLVVLANVIASCKRSPPPPPPPSSTPPTPLVSVASVAAAPSASPIDAGVDPDADVKKVATAWNDAINARDLVALGALHTGDVRFYGVLVDWATYTAKMKAALDKDPAFHQTIGAFRVQRTKDGNTKIWFVKNDGKAEHAAYLVLMQMVGGSWKIIEESDFATDVNVKCVKSDKATLTGTIGDGSFIWHDQITPTTVLTLVAPICVDRVGTDEWGYDGPNRIDGVDDVTLVVDADASSTLPRGTKVRVVGTSLQPHTGSGHYSTPIVMFVESVTALSR